MNKTLLFVVLAILAGAVFASTDSESISTDVDSVSCQCFFLFN